MAALTPAGKDILFVLGLGITASAVIASVKWMLIFSRDVSVIGAVENKPSYITQDVEDSLKPSTLEKLLDSPNYCIQETTAVIICERALHDEAVMESVLWHIAQPEHHLREKAIRALSMMINSTTINIINKPATYAALVKSLEYSVTDYKHNDYDLEWDNYHLRDVAEQGCLMVLGQLVDKYGVEGVVKSRFVERWLEKEPWGETEELRFTNFAESLRKKNRINDITVPLFRDRIGRRQLINAKLIPREFEMDLRHRDTKMINGESTAGEDFDGMFVENRRGRDQSAEDDRIRRRHREAMVLNDGTRPLGRDDIIQRESSFSH